MTLVHSVAESGKPWMNMTRCFVLVDLVTLNGTIG